MEKKKTGSFGVFVVVLHRLSHFAQKKKLASVCECVDSTLSRIINPLRIFILKKGLHTNGITQKERYSILTKANDEIIYIGTRVIL